MEIKKTYLNAEQGGFALYAGLDEIYGGWLCETGGDPVTLNDCEDWDDQETIDQVNNAIADPLTPWEDLTDEDLEYINDTLVAWGVR